MDNLRNFFGGFWKPERPEAKTESKTSSKLNPPENCPKDSNSNSHHYDYSHKSTSRDRIFDDEFECPNNQDISRYNPSHHNQRPPLVFGDLFAVVGEMFRDMERSMHDMNQFFEGSEFFNRPGFGMLENITPRYDPNDIEDYDIDEEESRKGNWNRDTNLRDQILKADLPPLSDKEKIDTVLDDLYKEKKLDLKDLPLLADENKSNQLVPKRNQPIRTRTSSQSSYSFINGKWQLKEKLVKETNEGKEVTTRTTNEKGEVDTTTEFFPYNSPGRAVKSFDNGEDDLMRIPSIFDRFFKPRM